MELDLGSLMGTAGLEAGLLGKQKVVSVDGPNSLLGSMSGEAVKNKKNVNGLGLGKSSQFVWSAKTRTRSILGISK